MKHIDYRWALREGGVNSGQGFTGGVALLLRSCASTGGGCKEPMGKLGRASHCAVGQMRRGNQGQESSSSVSSIFLPGDGGGCSDLMCRRLQFGRKSDGKITSPGVTLSSGVPRGSFLLHNRKDGGGEWTQ